MIAALLLTLVATDVVDRAAELLGLGSAERSALRRGDVVAEVVETPDRTEVMSVGAVRVAASSAAFRACIDDPWCLRDSGDLIDAGPLETATGDVLSGLSLERTHLQQLRECRVGRCEMRLSREAIDDFRGIDWDSPSHAVRAAGVLRTVLLGYARRYADLGDEALVVFADRPEPISSAASTKVLLQRPLPVLDVVPGLRERLQGPPSGASAPGRDTLYWYKERRYRAVVLAIHHLAVGTLQGGSLEAVVAASKQVYSSRYLNASVEVTALLSDPEARVAVLLHASRSRTDIRPSGFTWLERLLLRRLVRGRLRDQLRATVRHLEGRAAAAAATR